MLGSEHSGINCVAMENEFTLLSLKQIWNLNKSCLRAKCDAEFWRPKLVWGGDFSDTFSCTAAKSTQLLPLCFTVTVSRGIWAPISPSTREQQRKKRLEQLYLTCLLLADCGRMHFSYKWLLFLLLAAWTISVHSEVAINLQHLQKHWAGFSIPRCFQSSKPQLSRNVFSRDLLLYRSCILHKSLMKFKCYDIDLWNRNCFLCWTPVHRQSPWTLYLGIESSLLDSRPWECISYN